MSSYRALDRAQEHGRLRLQPDEQEQFRLDCQAPGFSALAASDPLAVSCMRLLCLCVVPRRRRAHRGSLSIWCGGARAARGSRANNGDLGGAHAAVRCGAAAPALSRSRLSVQDSPPPPTTRFFRLSGRRRELHMSSSMQSRYSISMMKHKSP